MRHTQRHPFDRGSHLQLQITAFFRVLMCPKWWAKHPAPFAKTHRGRLRRAERKFALKQKDLDL
jgi:hypothetical protein